MENNDEILISKNHKKLIELLGDNKALTKQDAKFLQYVLECIGFSTFERLEESFENKECECLILPDEYEAFCDELQYDEIDESNVKGIFEDAIRNAESKETKDVLQKIYEFEQKEGLYGENSLLEYMCDLQEKSKQKETKEAIDSIIQLLFVDDVDVEDGSDDGEDLPF